MPPATPLERAQQAAARLAELDALAQDRDAWQREVERLTVEASEAHDRASDALYELERAEDQSKSQGSFFTKMKNRISGTDGGDDADRAGALLAAAQARCESAENEWRQSEAALEEAKRKRMLSEGAASGREAARATERKVFASLEPTGEPAIDEPLAQLKQIEKRCEAWRSAERAAVARRSHAFGVLQAIEELEKSWPEIHGSLGDVIRGKAGGPPAGTIEAAKKLRAALWHGARAGVPGLSEGVLGEIGAIAVHEIDRTENVLRIIGMLTAAVDAAHPIAGAAEKSCAELSSQLSSAEGKGEELRAELHRLLTVAIR